MVIQNNSFVFTAATLKNNITIKGGTGNTGQNTSIYLPQPAGTNLDGMQIIVRKTINMGIVNIYAYQTTGNSNTNIIIPNNSVTGVNTISLDSSKSSCMLQIIG